MPAAQEQPPTLALNPQATAIPGAKAAPPPSPQATGSPQDVAAAYVKKKYPDLAGGRIAKVPSAAVASLLHGREAFYFSVGGMYPLATVGPHVRRVLVVDVGKQEVVFDFDSTVKDDEAASTLGGFLPPAGPKNLAEVAATVAVFAPLDPFFSQPDPDFQARKGPGRRTTATWSGPRFRYVVVFGPDGKVVSLKREDTRPKPICSEHRARAQALLADGLRVGDVIWDELTARLAPHHYLYEVRAANGARAGLAVVEKGPGAARFVSAHDRTGLAALARDVLLPVRNAESAAESAQVVLALQAHAGAAEQAPLGAPFFAVEASGAGWLATSRELGASVRFGADGRLAP